MHPFWIILLTGLGATAVVDVWSLARRRLLGTPLPNYGLVGRWIAHLPRGTFRHASISTAAPVRGEDGIGWATHYLIGIAFAFLLFAVAGGDWFDRPTLAPALLFGIVTVTAPFLVMQPAMGAGFAASRTPRPTAARLQSLTTHAFFGLGLYVSALVANKLLTGA